MARKKGAQVHGPNQRSPLSGAGQPYWFWQLMIVIAVAGWLLIIGGSLLWGMYVEKNQIESLAMNTARANFDKDQAFRTWGAFHGGVYVPITPDTPPNPYLSHLPERDIVTPSGKHLTLMNPAYMVRQMMAMYGDLYGIKGRITSLAPLNPANGPDPWETMALKRFERGVPEVFEFSEIGGQPVVRLMRPMLVQANCLKCHGQQGYKVGDIRGGVGVSVPVTPYLELGRKLINKMLISHLLIGILGLGLISIIGRWAGQRLRERLIAQNLLEQAHGELEREVGERTRELREANAKLAELDQMKSMFIASMSHELRTPLNSIMGFTRVILDGMSGTLTARQEDQLQRVYRSSEHLLGMINDIIDISKIESGIVAVAAHDFLLQPVIGEAIANIRGDAEKKGLRLVAEVPGDLHMVTDEKRLFQCVLNLLSNAVKFSEKGTIALTVAEQDHLVEISVRDNGIGIAPEDLARLFQPFERIESHISIEAGGTGLGLYLTRKLVSEVLQGEITVESEVGKGSTFRLTLPANLPATAGGAGASREVPESHATEAKE